MNWYKKFHAWLLKRWRDEEESPQSKEFKSNYFTSLHGTVAEIGAGAGANLKYYPKDIRWIAIEPNNLIHETLRKGAEKFGITNFEVKRGTGENIPMPDNSCDYVIATFVLCSVVSQAKVLSEIKRILKPAGKYYYIEHVAAPRGTLLRFYQNLINPLNRAYAGNCNLNRETLTEIQKAGFRNVTAQKANIKMFMTNWPHLWGTAEK